MDTNYSGFECIWARCILGKSIIVAILVYLLVNAAAIPVSSALLMVYVVPTPPEFT